MIQIVIAALGGSIAALAFPPFGPGVLIVLGVALLLWSLRNSPRRSIGVWSGVSYGIPFFTVLMWWSTELGLIALVPLVLLMSGWFALLGWFVTGYRSARPGSWLLIAVGAWSLMELLRYHFPFSGLEWGGAGYALSEYHWIRLGAPLVGTSGWTVLVVAVAGALMLAITERSLRWWTWTVLTAPLLAIGGVVVASGPFTSVSIDYAATSVAIVQGSTPCPFEKCPPDERLRTFEQHLELTRTIDPGAVDLVVWAEGSTGSANADPVLNEEIAGAIADEARRIGAWFLVGSDRPISETQWVNANVVFNDQGEIVGEYRKQQGVPFGEYIPFRPLFDWIPDLAQVPRDMVPGDGPVVFDFPAFPLGSVISFEGSFARYGREHVQAGAQVMVVATNEGSYGYTSVSDQLIGMTRMRAAELGVPVIHGAVTGRSVFIDEEGEFNSAKTGLGTEEILYGEVVAGHPTVYARVGDWLMYLAVIGGIIGVWRSRSLLVSEPKTFEGEPDVGSP
ncbi:MAG TPA: apolipoprotein N-acyltransferase [Acidimicrobiia bacterium]